MTHPTPPPHLTAEQLQDLLKLTGASDSVELKLTVPDNAYASTANALGMEPVSYTHLRAHETVLDLVCRLLLEKKKTSTPITAHSPPSLYSSRLPPQSHCAF